MVPSRVQNAVDEQLTKKGMREDERNPDVYVVAHLGAKNMADVEYMPEFGGWRHWRWMGPSVFVNRYVEGTTIIDIVDAKTARSVPLRKAIRRTSRCGARSEMTRVLMCWMCRAQKKIDKIAADAFKHFPPKAAA
jgi:hypothetical protein